MRIPTLVRAAVAVALTAACATAGPADGRAASPGGNESGGEPRATTAETAAAAPTTEQGPQGPPSRWVGVTAGGDALHVVEDGDVVREISSPLPPDGPDRGAAGAVAQAQLLEDGVAFSTCCEPASGQYWFYDFETEQTSNWGVGTLAGADAAGRALAYDPNGLMVMLDAGPSPDTRVLSSRDGHIPTDAAWSPDGDTLVVEGADNETSRLFGLRIDAEAEFFDSGTVIATGRTPGEHPAHPAVDAQDRVWYALEDTSGRHEVTLGGIVADALTGEVIDEFNYAGTVVDQHFDASGRYLIIAYANGSVRWRSVDGQEGELAPRGYDRADW